MDNQENNQLIKKDDAPFFTEAELEELNKYIAGGGRNVAPDRAVNFLTLYLEGRSVEQIHQRFPQWPKGAFLYARYKYGWDKAREEYVESLTKEVVGRLTKVKAEVVHYLLDSLAVTHKEFARAMEVYLQNPTEDNLPRNRIKNLKEYRETIKTLGEALTMGQVSAQENSSMPQVAVQINAADGAIVKITTNEHSQALKQLAGGDQEEEKK